MTCNCITMCRVPDVETLGGRFPMPRHAPNCNDFRQEEFTRIEFDGSYCVMENHEAEAMIADSDGKYSVSKVMLTRDQFDNMAEFTGF